MTVNRLGRQDGFSLHELTVVTAIMGLIFLMVFTATKVVDVGGKVIEEEGTFAREISTPLHVMDKALSQNKQVEVVSPFVSDANRITIRGPLNPDTRKYRRHIFRADSTGNFIEELYEVPWGGTAVKIAENTWATHNANVRLNKGPVFRYLGPSGETTIPAGARSVLVELWCEVDGDEMVGRRQIYFRNR